MRRSEIDLAHLYLQLSIFHETNAGSLLSFFLQYTEKESTVFYANGREALINWKERVLGRVLSS